MGGHPNQTPGSRTIRAVVSPSGELRDVARRHSSIRQALDDRRGPLPAPVRDLRIVRSEISSAKRSLASRSVGVPCAIASCEPTARARARFAIIPGNWHSVPLSVFAPLSGVTCQLTLGQFALLVYVLAQFVDDRGRVRTGCLTVDSPRPSSSTMSCCAIGRAALSSPAWGWASP